MDERKEVVDAKKRSRGWVFTLNNYTEDDEKLLQASFGRVPHLRYILYGREVGEEEGTPHLQGYAYFVNAIMRSTLVRNIRVDNIPIFAKCYVAPAGGTAHDNFVYCTKGGDWFEAGERPMSQYDKGEASLEMWQQAMADAKVGHFENIPASLYVRYYATWQKIYAESRPEPVQIPFSTGLDNYWFYGPPRTGKSSAARSRWPGAYDKLCSKWWDDYRHEETILIEEVMPGMPFLTYFLRRWCDYYPFRAEVKNSHLKKLIRPKRFVVTSNYTIEQCFADDPVAAAAVRERFKIWRFEKEFTFFEKKNAE